MAVAIAPSLAADRTAGAFPGRNGRIAFVETVKQEHRIVTARTDGTQRKVVALGTVDISEPRWSPDGKLLAFNRGRRIAVVREDGSKLRTLAQGADGAWSPSGQRIVFDRGRDLWLMRADGTRQRRLLVAGHDPAWSPDGRAIAFLRSGNLFVVGATGRSPKLVTGDPISCGRGGNISDGSIETPPSWSPDSTRIAFAESCGSTFTVHADGTSLVEVGGATDPYDNGITHPAWSPDGVQIVVEHDAATLNFLELHHADGSGAATALRLKGSEPDWQPLPHG